MPDVTVDGWITLSNILKITELLNFLTMLTPEKMENVKFPMKKDSRLRNIEMLTKEVNQI